MSSFAEEHVLRIADCFNKCVEMRRPIQRPSEILQLGDNPVFHLVDSWPSGKNAHLPSLQCKIHAKAVEGTLLSYLTRMAKSSYLERLPRIAQKRGSTAKGQIELVTKKKQLRQIDEETASELKGSALGKNGKRIGILLEDEVHMIVRDAVKYPSGATGAPMRIIGKTQFDGVNGVVALAHCEGTIYLRRIFRHPVRSWEIEAVRGKRETGTTARATARKEVKEELGYPVRSVTKIGTICPETALLASILDVYWVELGPGPRKEEPEPKEAFGPIVKVTPQELIERIASGEIRDSYTITATLLAQSAGYLAPVSPRETSPEEPAGAGEEQ